MPVVISTYKNSAFVSEKITGVYKKFNPETNKLTNIVEIDFDNGVSRFLKCKNAKERDELYDRIVDAMTHTNYGIH